MSLVGLYCTEREDLKGQVVMGIIVDPFTKKSPLHQNGSFQSRCFEPKSQKMLECSSRDIENPLKYYDLLCRNDVCTMIWLLQFVKQAPSL